MRETSEVTDPSTTELTQTAVSGNSGEPLPIRIVRTPAGYSATDEGSE